MKTNTSFFRENTAFLIFLFIFCWIFILKNQFGVSKSWEDFAFYPDAPFWFFLKVVFIFWWVSFIKVRINKSSKHEVSLGKKYVLFFGVGLLSYVVIGNVFGLVISFIFDTYSRNFGSLYHLVYKNIGSVIDFIIFGGFSLAYLYYKENVVYQKQVVSYEISKAKNEITQLKAQLNPHFLFNNLNILDQLIEEDTERASLFLNRFSELYRYSLYSANKELVLLEEELFFAEGYFKLMEEKYQGYYQLNIEESLYQRQVVVPPFCLQVLIENAITHNKGTLKTPVNIMITEDNGIKAVNNKVLYPKGRKGNGVALANLSKQFRLLAENTIKIHETEEEFEVVLPLITTLKPT
ncbi:sensor histidine kinase [Tenacibaculum sp. SDUM215027]|uniref:sensor histidine kinase n=1 Tax=Tenacibaculum sp. SDUM215027 TaxID=3422596 RepID=UPI003D31B975